MAGSVAADAGWLTSAWQGAQWVVAAGGRWDISAVPRLQSEMNGVLPRRGESSVCLDLSGLTALDTAGALLIDRLARRLREQGHTVALVGARDDLCTLLKDVKRAARVECPGPPPHRPMREIVDRVGEATLDAVGHTRELLAFLGMMAISAARLFRNPTRFRAKPFAFHLEQVGLNALPIVGLLAFLIGVVLAYQGADQLRQFGAEIFVVNLLGISVLRELGILITAIIIAGRSGSAFTAQIGTMKVNQEVDAMRTLGLDPMELLVIPRVLALVVALPLLAFYANVVALLGGAMMAYVTLDITFGQFLKQLQMSVSTTTLLVGLCKAPVFAVVIGLVGCYEGMRVSGSAESVGRLTTRSVVVSIFLVIVLNALFSVLFSYLGI